MLSTTAGMLVGRDTELEAIAALLDPGADRRRALLLEGEAGIGKTTLWRAAIEEAGRRGFRVLSCSGVESETRLSFTAIRDLVGDVFDEVADRLPSVQARALAVVLLREEATGPPPERETIAVSLLTALRILAAEGPLLLAVDDVQWVDAASAEPLSYAVRRLGSEPVAVLLAHRPAAETEVPAFAGVEPERLQVLEVEALSVGALGRIIHRRVGLAYPRPTLRHLHELSGGNPFFALELARALGKQERPLAPGTTLQVPRTLRRLITDRLEALPRPTIEALSLAAAASRPTLGLVAAALGADPLPSLRPAVEAGVLEFQGDTLTFTHPLFAAAAYELAVLNRRSVHARLAELVPDPEERARHLALASGGPDEAIARRVDEGAATAFARGDPAAAADLAAQARRLTPGAEETAAQQRGLAEIDYRFAAGDTLHAAALVDELLARRPPGPVRARLLSRLARLRHFVRDMDASLTLLHEALALAGEDDALRVEIEEGLAWGLLLARRDVVAAAEHARSAVSSARRGDDAGLAEALAAQALTEFVLGRPWKKTMESALSLEASTLELRVLRHPSFAHGYCLSCADDLDGAREVFSELRRRAEVRGDEGSMPSILNHLTLVELLAGRWPEAEAHAEECYARAVESGQQPTQTSIVGKQALVSARRGDVERAREAARLALTRAGAAPDGSQPQAAMVNGGETAIWALGFVALSQGEPDEARRLLDPMTRALLAAGVREPGEVRCLPDLIEALVELEQTAEAEELVSELEAWARTLRRPSAAAAAGRARGLLLGASGDADAALAALSAAAARYDGVPLPFERGRALLALGAQQRRLRQRRDARETLQRALAIFEELGAGPWAANARAELARIGGRGPATGELTPSERRIAELVAEGMTNKEVAAVLVIADRTVESALTQVYRKLGVRSRTELARKLSAGG